MFETPDEERQHLVEVESAAYGLQRPDHGGGMLVPVEGCDCEDCEYARYWDSLSDEDRNRELQMMAEYVEERDGKS